MSLSGQILCSGMDGTGIRADGVVRDVLGTEILANIRVHLNRIDSDDSTQEPKAYSPSIPVRHIYS